MCRYTDHFTKCGHHTEVYVECSWKNDKFHRFADPINEGFCRSCKEEEDKTQAIPDNGDADYRITNSRDELTKALQSHCSKPREVAANMLNAIKEVRGEDLYTPQRIANFLKTSKKARNALCRMMSGQKMDWLPNWLYTTPWSPPVFTENSGRQNSQLQKCLKQKRKRKNKPFFRAVDSCEIEKPSNKVSGDKSKDQGSRIKLGTQRSVTGADISVLKQPKRQFDGSLDLRGAYNSDFVLPAKALRLNLPDCSLRPRTQSPANVPFSGPPLASQLSTIKYPLKNTVPEGRIPGIDVPYGGPTSDPSFNKMRELERVMDHNLSVIPYVPRTMEPVPQIIPTMVPDVDFGSFKSAPVMDEQRFSRARALSDELRTILGSHPQGQYLMRADFEPAARASTVFDGEERARTITEARPEQEEF